MLQKLEILRTRLLQNAPLLVAYSGGVDSSCLLAVAQQTLGARVLGVIADSPSLPRHALAAALAQAGAIGAHVEVVQTTELDDERYASNPVNRCYFCKAELFARMETLAKSRGFAALAYGENADDARHVRPGRGAADEFAVIAPLKEAGLSKAEIREIARTLGLAAADAPAQPCLSSRIPHGTRVTALALRMVEQGEEQVRRLGFKVFRVRHLAGSTPEAPCRARVQIASEEMSRLRGLEGPIEEGLRAVGYAAIEIDPAGYQSPT